MQSFLEKLINNLVVAAFFPALVFCTTLLLIFKQSLSPILIGDIVQIFQELGLFVLGVAFTVSLFLYYLKDFIFELYRGYGFPSAFSYFESRRAKKIQNKIASLNDEINTLTIENNLLESSTENELIRLDYFRKIDRQNDELYAVVAYYRQSFPATGKVYGTRLGNIFSAAEANIAYRYGIDPVVFWPLLIQLIPSENRQRIDEAFNRLSLLLNSSLLSFGLSSIFLLSAAIAYLRSDIWQKNYLISSGIALIGAYVFYRLAIPITKEYSQLYCGAFDLFRFNLLKQFCIGLPGSLSDEIKVWSELSYLLAVGDYFGETRISYNHGGGLKKGP